MRWGCWTFKAAAAAAIAVSALLTPGHAVAASIFDSGVAGSSEFSIFPFWQKILTDMAPAAQPRLMLAASPSVAPAPQPQLISAAFTTGVAPAPQPQLMSIAFNVAPSSQPQPMSAVLTSAAPPAASCDNERTCAPPAWLEFLDSLHGQTPQAQLNAVNQWANAKPYVDDFVNWHVPDYWETPGEFIAHGGDCEDYAIAKYFSLVRLGFSPDDLRIVVVDDSNAHVFHAVLVAKLDGKEWLLDNQSPQIVEMSSVPQYTPIYSLNQKGWWMHANPTIRLAGITITAGPAAAH